MVMVVVVVTLCPADLQPCLCLQTLTGHTSSVHDIAWAPDMGRTFYMIATASKDKTLRIWKIRNGGIESNGQCNIARGEVAWAPHLHP